MDNTVDGLIQQAMAEAKTGNKSKAKNLLTEALKIDKEDVRIWYLLSQVVETKEQKIYCLKKILEIDPINQQAIVRLNELAGEKPSMPAIPAIPSPKTTQFPTPPKKKSNSGMWIIIGGLAVLAAVCLCVGLLSLGGSGSGNGETGSKTTEIVPTDKPILPILPIITGKHKIIYKVEGTAQTAMITYNNEQNGTEQLNGARLPWIKNFNMERGDFPSIVAQSGDYGRSITCIILVDGKEWKRSTSSGDFVVVTCNGWLDME